MDDFETSECISPCRFSKLCPIFRNSSCHMEHPIATCLKCDVFFLRAPEDLQQYDDFDDDDDDDNFYFSVHRNRKKFLDFDNLIKCKTRINPNCFGYLRGRA